MPTVIPPPNLHRVGVTVLAIALVANVALWNVSNVDDTFANVIAAASAVAAVALVATALVTSLGRWREEAALVSLAVWLANFAEFALESDAGEWSRFRQCGFYAAFAVLSLGVFLYVRAARREV